MFDRLVTKMRSAQTERKRGLALLRKHFPLTEDYVYHHVLNLVPDLEELQELLTIWAEMGGGEGTEFYYWLKAYKKLHPLDQALLQVWTSTVDRKTAGKRPKFFEGVGQRVFQTLAELHKIPFEQVPYILPKFIKVNEQKSLERDWLTFYTSPKALIAQLGLKDWLAWVQANKQEFLSLFPTSSKKQRVEKVIKQNAQTLFFLRSLALRLGRLDLFDKYGREVSEEAVINLVNELEGECKRQGIKSRILL